MNELILIVEDSRTQSMLLENILVGQSYQVAIVDNGDNALKWLSENKSSLVISDIVMPGMNGYELCRQIKAQKTTNNIPVILLTSLNGTEEVIEGLVSGADSFITKPYDQDYLISHIEKILADQSGVETGKELFGVEIIFEGKKRIIQSDQQQTIKLLLNIYEGAIQQNAKLLQTQEQLKYMNDNLESLVDERTRALSEEIKTSTQISEKLMESEEIWRSLVTTIPDYIALHNSDAKFLFLNHYAEGFSKKETIGKSMFDFISDESKEISQQNFEKCLKSGKIQVFETTAFGDNRSVRLYENTYIPIIQQGKKPNVMVIARDITKRQLAENEIRNKNEQLQKVNAEKDKFFSIIAHDLRNPIGSFMSFTQLLVEDLPGMELDVLQKMAENMQSTAEGLYRLLENLLEWAKIQRGLVSYNPKLFSLLHMVNESIFMVQESAKMKNIGISCTIPEVLEVFVDNNILQTVLRNLISNAIKFTHKEGSIHLTAIISDTQCVQVSVKDSGIGMSPAMLENIFEITSTSNRMGTEGEPSSGLGLILCKELMGKLGGEIWVESEVGKGSEFKFTIPTEDAVENPEIKT